MDEDWQDLAACANIGWSYHRWFAGEDPNLRVQDQQERACMLCSVCPVQVECLRECIHLDTDLMVWGGLTPSQRKRYLDPALRHFSVGRAMVEVLGEVGKRTVRRVDIALAEGGMKRPDPGERPSRDMIVAILGPVPEVSREGAA